MRYRQIGIANTFYLLKHKLSYNYKYYNYTYKYKLNFLDLFGFSKRKRNILKRKLQILEQNLGTVVYSEIEVGNFLYFLKIKQKLEIPSKRSRNINVRFISLDFKYFPG